MTDSPPALSVSVVICTRDRPAAALNAARTVLADAPSVELIIVDQSTDGEALARQVGALASPRVTCIPCEPRGLSAARNVGVHASTGHVVAFLDDDCEAQSGWLVGLQAAFARDERVALAFGNVRAAPYDRREGFVPAYHVNRFTIATDLGGKSHIEGIGACMAIRRAAWTALHGFDESLGAGAPFRAGEDADFVIRALLGGWHVAETPEASVLHHGFRTWNEGRELIDSYMYGLGASNMKMLRLGGLRAVGPLAALAWRWAAGAPVVDLNHRPPRMARLRAFLRGARDSRRRPLQAGGRLA